MWFSNFAPLRAAFRRKRPLLIFNGGERSIFMFKEFTETAVAKAKEDISVFALSYMKKFSNIFELADILGHANLETTRIYTTASIEQKRQRLEQLDIMWKLTQYNIMCSLSTFICRKYEKSKRIIFGGY